MSKKYIFWDLETSGLSPAFDSILQCGAILTDENFNQNEFVINSKLFFK